MLFTKENTISYFGASKKIFWERVFATKWKCGMNVLPSTFVCSCMCSGGVYRCSLVNRGQHGYSHMFSKTILLYCIFGHRMFTSHTFKIRLHGLFNQTLNGEKGTVLGTASNNRISIQLQGNSDK